MTTPSSKSPILIACECSQTICAAWRAAGYEAYSCDIQPCYGGHPEWHIQDDALVVMQHAAWGLIIAHPPCTYLSKAGSVAMFPTAGLMDMERVIKMIHARDFFMKFYAWDKCPIAIENPMPLRAACLPKATQFIQPYDFGHKFSKLTYLWLKNLPPLLPTHGRVLNHVPWLNHCSSTSNRRSKTFEGIAQAMVEQWADYIK